MFIAQLGRQPELSIAELRAVFGDKNVNQVANDFATVNSATFDLDKLGGTIKYGEIIETLPRTSSDASALISASKFITTNYRKKWQNTTGKITLGTSAYNMQVSPRAVQKIGLILKSSLKSKGVNIRLIPNNEPALSTATSHNNRLGTSERKIELIIVRTNRGTIIAESRGVQNITAYTHRDRHRPRRDAFVGMLPPKLAQIMLNLAVGAIDTASNPVSILTTTYSRSALFSTSATGTSIERSAESSLGSLSQSPRISVGSAGCSAQTPTTEDERVARGGAAPENSWGEHLCDPGPNIFRGGPSDRTRGVCETGEKRLAEENHPIVLDPFCGTGTVLQEALLHNFDVIGSDLSEKMVTYTTENLNWLQKNFDTAGKVLYISQADAVDHRWKQSKKISAVVCETYLGQPFSAPPSPTKLKEVSGNCNHIISKFLTNIHSQLQPGTPLCIAVPAWMSADGRFTHLPLIKQLSKLGYERIISKPLLYHRPEQVVAREILVLKVK